MHYNTAMDQLPLVREASKQRITTPADTYQVCRDIGALAQECFQILSLNAKHGLLTLGDELPQGFDVVACSLFLHHLRDEEALLLLRKMAGAARRLLVVSDLARSPVVHADGGASVRAAFTPDEMAAVARQADLRGAIIRHGFPVRFVLTWNPA